MAKMFAYLSVSIRIFGEVRAHSGRAGRTPVEALDRLKKVGRTLRALDLECALSIPQKNQGSNHHQGAGRTVINILS